MKWKVLFVIFFVALLGIFLGNQVVINKVNFSPSSLLRKISFSKKKISAISDIPKYEVKIISDDKLQDILDDWNFWKIGIVLRNQDNTKPLEKIYPKSITFHLTNEVQKNDLLISKDTNDKEIILSSSGETMDNSENLHIYIYFSDDFSSLLAKSKNSNFNREFTTVALRALFQISHPNEKINSSDQQSILQIINKGNFIEITNK